MAMNTYAGVGQRTSAVAASAPLPRGIVNSAMSAKHKKTKGQNGRH